MNEKPDSTEEKPSLGELILPALFLSSFALQSHGIITGLLLIDIGLTFGLPVGVTAQIRTVSEVAGVFFALLMTVLSIRFRHKALLLAGLLLAAISALGCGVASVFGMMLVSFPMWGIALAMTGPMRLTLVAEYFPREKRPSAIGWIVAGMSLGYVIGLPLIGFIAGLGGWRLAFLGYALPVSVLSLLLAAKGIPSPQRTQQSGSGMSDYVGGFKAVFLNRSAVACLVGTSLSIWAWQAVLVYGPSFLRQRFHMSTGLVSVVMVVTSIFYTLGGLVSGRLVKRFGRKPLTVMSALFAGVSTVSGFGLADPLLSVVLVSLGCLFFGIRLAVSGSLTLEQVPKHRGTMMSLDSIANSMGAGLGAGIGGLVLLLLNYESIGAFLGAMAVVAAIVIQLLAIDPTKTGMQTHS